MQNDKVFRILYMKNNNNKSAFILENMLKPYIWITWPTTEQEVNMLNLEFEAAGINMNSSHTPMIGFLASKKTLNGGIVENPTYRMRYPQISNLRWLMELSREKVLNMIHYNTWDQITLHDDIKWLFSWLYEDWLCRAIQLNMPWPRIEEIDKTLQKFPELKIVFQAKSTMYSNMPVDEFLERLLAYKQYISYILFDPSEWLWKTVELDPKFLTLFKAVRKEFGNIITGFAWALNWDNVYNKVQTMIWEIWDANFFIDSESQLRIDDTLSKLLVKIYLQESMSAFNQIMPT